jgi:hypothetical protein
LALRIKFQLIFDVRTKVILKDFAVRAGSGNSAEESLVFAPPASGMGELRVHSDFDG